MDKFNFEQLMNIEVPGECIKKALEIPAENKRKVFSARLYRFAAGLAACVVIAAAVIFSAIFGVNKNVKLTNLDGGSYSAPSVGETVPGSSDFTNPTEAPSEGKTGSILSNSSVTEPVEKSELIYEEKIAEKPEATTETKAKSNTKPSKANEARNKTSTEAPGNNTEPAEEPKTESINNNIKYIDSDEWLIGAAPDDKPKPTRPNVTEVYGCRFMTSADKNTAVSDNCYCRIEDESGKLLGSGGLYSDSRKAQKYDWGNPNWPPDIKYTADFVMYYDQNYTVTFYNSDGNILWSGNVYLQQGKDDYMLY